MPDDPDQASWYIEHLQPHEELLRSWLRTRFPDEPDLDDVLQEAISRVLQARETTKMQSPKAFLFATARNLILGRLRHQRVTGERFLAGIEVESVLDETTDVSGAVAHSEELELLTQAIQSLPARCRQVITLRKIYGLSPKDTAAQLGISENTVAAQGAIGLRKIVEYFDRLNRQPPHHHG